MFRFLHISTVKLQCNDNNHATDSSWSSAVGCWVISLLSQGHDWQLPKITCLLQAMMQYVKWPSNFWQQDVTFDYFKPNTKVYNFFVRTILILNFNVGYTFCIYQNYTLTGYDEAYDRTRSNFKNKIQDTRYKEIF